MARARCSLKCARHYKACWRTFRCPNTCIMYVSIFNGDQWGFPIQYVTVIPPNSLQFVSIRINNTHPQKTIHNPGERPEAMQTSAASRYVSTVQHSQLAALTFWIGIIVCSHYGGAVCGSGRNTEAVVERKRCSRRHQHQQHQQQQPQTESQCLPNTGNITKNASSLDRCATLQRRDAIAVGYRW